MKRRDFAQIAMRFSNTVARTLVRHKIEITLPIPRFDVLQSMPFFRERPQGFRQHLKRVHLQRRFAGFGEKTGSLHADEIAKIEQSEKLDRLRADFFRVNVNLNASGRVAQIEKMTFAHVAMRGDAARCAKSLAFLELFAHLRNRAALPQSRRQMARHLSHEARRAFCAAVRLTRFLHPSRANLKRCEVRDQSLAVFKLNVLQSSWDELVDKDRSRVRSRPAMPAKAA